MRQVVIGTRVYARKMDAEAAIREVRDRYETGTATAEDDDFLRDLVAMHPEAEAKIGCGIDHFETRRNMNNVGFWIIRTDGKSATDFSFGKCLSGCSAEDLARSAMRDAVQDQLAAVRQEAISNGMSCPFTGELLTKDNCHADHEEPLFIELADEFAASEGGYSNISTVAEDGTFGSRFVSPEQAERWAAFHRAKAKLRAVSKKANLSILRRRK